MNASVSAKRRRLLWRVALVCFLLGMLFGGLLLWQGWLGELHGVNL